MHKSAVSCLRRAKLALFTASAVALTALSPAQALTINAYVDTSITSLSVTQQSNIDRAILAATSFYGEFTNPATVNILFQLGPTGLGQSSSGSYYIPYGDYTSVLAADSGANPQNTVLSTAVANLPNGNIPPLGDPTGTIGVDRWMGVNSAQLNALGLGPLGFIDGFLDGVVQINGSSAVSWTTKVGPHQFSALPVLQHEIDEVLGGGGGGSDVGDQNTPGLGGVYGALDLYRYANGAPAFSTDPSTNPYFSIDGGATPIMGFNNTGKGDYGDWAKTGCGGVENVQDYFGCPGLTPSGLTLSSPEIPMLESLGYNLPSTPAPFAGYSLALPEPAPWATMLVGFGGLGVTLRSRRKAAAAV